jgi:hypothetical protein
MNDFGCIMTLARGLTSVTDVLLVAIVICLLASYRDPDRLES